MPWHPGDDGKEGRQMLSRRSVLLGCTFIAFAAPAALHAQEAWTSYRNSRYGTSIAYQEFFEPDPPPANGDGQSFTGPEGANFRVYARQNSGDETPAGYLRELLAEPSHANVTEQSIKDNRVTITGTRGSLNYYESYLFSPRGVVHAFEMEYPAKFESDYAPTVERMARSFTGP
jgi:hypothetical protein